MKDFKNDGSIHKPVMLLTGQPGTGKTTIVTKILDLVQQHSGGFYTRETLSRGNRNGFEIVTLAGETACLATKNLEKTFADEVPFGAYKVNLDAVNLVAVPALVRAAKHKKIVIVDEIGPMEICSKMFCETIVGILNRDSILVFGTIVQRPNDFADRVKVHPRVILKTVTLENRDRIPLEIYSELMTYL